MMSDDDEDMGTAAADTTDHYDQESEGSDDPLPIIAHRRGTAPKRKKAPSSGGGGQPKKKKPIEFKVNYSLPVESLRRGAKVFQYPAVFSQYGLDLTCSNNPQYHHLTGNYASVSNWMAWFLYIPMVWWTAGAKGFSSMKYKEHKTMAAAYQFAIELMLYCAGMIDSFNTSKHIGLRCLLTYELVLAEGSSIHQPARQRKYAGKRLRLIAPLGGMSFGQAIESLIFENSKAIAAKMRTGMMSVPSDTPPRPGVMMRGMYTTLTKASWEKLCNDLMFKQSPDGYINNPHQYGVRSISHDMGYYNPENVFNLKQSIKVSCGTTPKPCAESLDIRNYYTLLFPDQGHNVNNWRAYVFPHGCSLVWSIDLSTFNLGTWRSCYLPEVERVFAHNPSEERKLWVQHSDPAAWNIPVQVQQTLRPGWVVSEALDMLPTDKADRENYFDETVNSTSVADMGFGMEQMTVMCKDIFQEEQAKCKGKTLIDLQQGRRAAQLRCIDEFFDRMVHPDAVLPTSNKAAVSWYMKYMETHSNLCMPRKNQHANLSSFENCLVQYLQAFEGLGKINNVHVKLLHCIVSIGYTWSEGKLHFNFLMMGPPGTSKSMVLLFSAENFCIEDTWRLEAYSSDKALTGLGADQDDPSHALIHDQMITINDEVPPSELGVVTGPGAAGIAASNSSTSDRESMRKNKMSSGTFRGSTFEANESGQRVFINKDVRCRGPVWNAANCGKQQIPEAMGNRYLIDEVAKTERHADDNGGLEALLLQTPTFEELRLWNEGVCERLKLTQWREWLVWKMIKRGIVVPVTMAAAKIIIVNTLKRAAAMGMRTGNARHMERLKMCIEALVVWDAIDLVFDSETSDLTDRVWHPHHLVEIEKHLVAKKRHVALAFGMCAPQWEDPMQKKIQNEVVEYVKKNTTRVVKNARLTNAQHSTGEPGMPGVTEVPASSATVVSSSNVIDCPHSFGKASTKPGTSPDDFGLPPSPHELLRRFALSICESMKDKPSFTVVMMAIEALSDSWVTIPNREEGPEKGTPIAVRVLEVTSQRISIPYTIMENKETEEGGRLKKALSEELNHRYAKQDDVLYGAPLSAENPYLMDYISIRPGGRSDRVMAIPVLDSLDERISQAINAMNQDTHLNNTMKPKMTDLDDQLDLNREFPPSVASMKMDIDDYATMMHNVEIGLSQCEERALPSNDTFKEKDNWWKKCQVYTTQTKPYPLCFDRFEFKPFIAARTEKRVAIEKGGGDYSSHDLLEARKRQKTAEREAMIAVVVDENHQLQSEQSAKEKRKEYMRQYELRRPFTPLLTARDDYKGGAKAVKAEEVNPLYEEETTKKWMSDWEGRKRAAPRCALMVDGELVTPTHTPMNDEEEEEDREW